MKTPNRDLLVLVKDEFDSEHSMERELEKLNRLLFQFETLDTISIAHEIFDLNKGKIIEQVSQVRTVLDQKKLKPFQFACNKN
ncbi:MAG TPA: hypothetical protein VD996_15910 [Chitinophagaceae bacterium]|nr:hypothetical protein [Chitinophagaceae bacterium]